MECPRLGLSARKYGHPPWANLWDNKEDWRYNREHTQRHGNKRPPPRHSSLKSQKDVSNKNMGVQQRPFKSESVVARNHCLFTKKVG